jgi:hypothetical protein
MALNSLRRDCRLYAPIPRGPKVPPPPALIALARLLGQHAARHIHKYRYEGLGRIALLIITEAKNNNNI